MTKIGKCPYTALEESTMDFIFNDKPKELIFKDEKNEREIVFLYEDPTADDRIKYGSEIAILFRGKEIADVQVEDITRVQFKFGSKILAGFRVQKISVNLSSDPEDPEYNPDWKKLIINRAPDLVILLAQTVFERDRFTPEKN
jgi:hypothetical protein